METDKLAVVSAGSLQVPVLAGFLFGIADLPTCQASPNLKARGCRPGAPPTASDMCLRHDQQMQAS